MFLNDGTNNSQTETTKTYTYKKTIIIIIKES